MKIAPREFMKKGVLSCLSKIYDPCGLASLAVIPLKILGQDCWKRKLAWVEEPEFLPACWGSLELIWWWKTSWSQAMVGGDTVSTRWYAGVTSCFYRCVIWNQCCGSLPTCGRYRRETTGQPGCIEVLSWPIPHLELFGTLIGSRLLKFLREEYDGILKIEEEFLWTDSTVVVAWINQGPCVSGVFVASRVKEIASIGGVWSWLPKDENRTDLPTRGACATMAQLSVSEIILVEWPPLV